jgi:hypothetical protein
LFLIKQVDAIEQKDKNLGGDADEVSNRRIDGSGYKTTYPIKWKARRIEKIYDISFIKHCVNFAL